MGGRGREQSREMWLGISPWPWWPWDIGAKYFQLANSEKRREEARSRKLTATKLRRHYQHRQGPRLMGPPSSRYNCLKCTEGDNILLNESYMNTHIIQEENVPPGGIELPGGIVPVIEFQKGMASSSGLYFNPCTCMLYGKRALFNTITCGQQKMNFKKNDSGKHDSALSKRQRQLLRLCPQLLHIKEALIIPGVVDL